jgi:hypothetical protein
MFSLPTTHSFFSRQRRRSQSKFDFLKSMGLTFYKDYTTETGNLEADYSEGSPKATFTRIGYSSTANATYVQSSGLVFKATEPNVPRFTYGYYDSTGLHAVTRGIEIQSANTNRIRSSDNLATIWTSSATGMTATANSTDFTSIYGTNTSTKLLAQSDDASVSQYVTVSTSSKYTFSFFARCNTGEIANVQYSLTADSSGVTSALATVTTAWSRFSLLATTDTADTTMIAQVGGVSSLATANIVYMMGVQVENSPYPHSYTFNTSAAATTSNSETLKYFNSGNRTAAQETIVIKFMPLGGSFANDGVQRSIVNTTNVDGIIYKQTTGAVIRYAPESSTAFSGVTTILLNASHTIACVAYGESETKNATIYLDGVLETNSTTNYATPDYGVNTSIGSDTNSGTQLNGLIQKVAFFNRALSAAEVLTVSNLM